MMNVKNRVIIALMVSALSLVISQASYGQASERKISIKKGQTIDIFNGIRKSGTEEAVTEYFNNVFPPASKFGFKVDGSFITSEIPTRGNYHAGFMSLMSWPSPKARSDFFEYADKNITYDFNFERRKIWSVFNFYEYGAVSRDYEFTVSRDKVYVITTYWKGDESIFNRSMKRIENEIRSAGGKVLMTLGKGHSPNGYLYEPTRTEITEWNSTEEFKKYLKKAGNDDIAGTTNVNQWITQFLFQPGQ